MRRSRLLIPVTELEQADIEHLRDALDDMLNLNIGDNPVRAWIVRWRNEFERRARLRQSRHRAEDPDAPE